MNRSQANRARIAARAASNPRPVLDLAPGVSPAHRVQTTAVPYAWTGTRKHGNKRSSKGGSGEMGARGMWATVAPGYMTEATIDSKWDQTVGSQQVRGSFR